MRHKAGIPVTRREALCTMGSGFGMLAFAGLVGESLNIATLLAADQKKADPKVVASGVTGKPGTYPGTSDSRLARLKNTTKDWILSSISVSRYIWDGSGSGVPPSSAPSTPPLHRSKPSEALRSNEPLGNVRRKRERIVPITRACCGGWPSGMMSIALEYHAPTENQLVGSIRPLALNQFVATDGAIVLRNSSVG